MGGRARVLYLHSSSGHYGADRQLQLLATGIDRDRYEPLVVLPGPGAVETARRRHDQSRLAAARPASPGGPAGIDALYRRSLLVLEDLADRATGAIIAAPEMDPKFLRSGGYGFVWPRDLAYISLEGLQAATRRPESALCRACLTREYPTRVPTDAAKLRFGPV